MIIEKTALTEFYNIITNEYSVVIRYQEYLNLGYSDWEILAVEDLQNGFEANLSQNELDTMKNYFVKSIVGNESKD